MDHKTIDILFRLNASEHRKIIEQCLETMDEPEREPDICETYR